MQQNSRLLREPRPHAIFSSHRYGSLLEVLLNKFDFWSFFSPSWIPPYRSDITLL